MANVFIIWDNKRLADRAKSILQERYPKDTFIVGGESSDSLEIIVNIISEMDSSDSAICLISKVPLSANVFYELGYLTSRNRVSYKILVVLVNLKRDALPFDIIANTSFVTNSKNFERDLIDIYLNSKQEDLKNKWKYYTAIFNDWAGAKKQLSTFNGSFINIERIHDYVIHSVMPAYYHSKKELTHLVTLCRNFPNDKRLDPLKNFIELIALHYGIGSNVSRFPLTLDNSMNIWLRFYGHLFNGLHAITLANHNQYESLLEQACLELHLAENCLDSIERQFFSGEEASTFYIDLLRGYLYNNLAAAGWYYDRFTKSSLHDADTQRFLNEAVEFRKRALINYDNLKQIERSGVIQTALSYEYLWGICRQAEYDKEIHHIAINKQFVKTQRDEIIKTRHDSMIANLLDDLIDTIATDLL